MKSIDAKGKTLKEVSPIIKASLNGEVVRIKNADHISGLAAGLKQGEMVIEGDTGDYLGVLNAGALIKVTQNVKHYVADNA